MTDFEEANEPANQAVVAEHPQHRAAGLNARLRIVGLNLEWIGGDRPPLQGFGAWTHQIVPEGSRGGDAVGQMVSDRVYFRFRHDSAQLYVGPSTGDKSYDGEFDMPADPPRLYAEIHEVTGNTWAGVLHGTQLEQVIQELFRELAPYDGVAKPTHRDRLLAMITLEEDKWSSTGTVEDAVEEVLTAGDRVVYDYGPVAKEREVNDSLTSLAGANDTAGWEEDNGQA